MKRLPCLWIILGLALGLRAQTPSPPDPEELALVTQIREKILRTQAESEAAAAQPYTLTIPGTDATFTMVPIPAGSFLLGSPEGEKERSEDEGPQVEVSLPAFWMGQHEVTWDAYEIFMFAPDREAPGTNVADAVSRPTKPYVEMNFGMGRDGYPAISMTHHAANKFCEWLSAKTGHFYRLPTEAEWEYAARAGSTTAYAFGDDPAQLAEYGWFERNQYEKVGQKKPNAWGLYDMHGNVWEWVLDQYSPETYAQWKAAGGKVSWVRSTSPYPHVVRGGSWVDTPDRLRSAARHASDPAWKMLDPQLPKSVWYHTSAPWVGFRIVRSAEIPSAEEMYHYWNNGVKYDD